MGSKVIQSEAKETALSADARRVDADCYISSAKM